ncbi:MAG TPA: thioesterase family protein [Trebonia sp.]|nr:thioesterase family protein [Trebonia sp.]
MTGAGPQGYDFDEETRLTTAGDGVFEAAISDRWSGLASVNGGFLMATCLKALSAVAPFPDPVTVSGLYLRPGNAGPAVVRTELIRAGRTTAFCEAHLSQAGKEVLRVTSAFADLSEATVAYAGASAPKLPAPEDCLELSGLATISLSKRFEYRGPAVPGWLTGSPSGEPYAEFWMRFADGRPADTKTLPFIVDAAPPAVLELGMSSTTIELTVHVRARPAAGWLACRTATRFVTGGYHEEDFEVWDSAGVLVAQSRQLALVRPFGTLSPLVFCYPRVACFLVSAWRLALGACCWALVAVISCLPCCWLSLLAFVAVIRPIASAPGRRWPPRAWPGERRPARAGSRSCCACRSSRTAGHRPRARR